MIPHSEHFLEVDKKSILRASGFIRNGLNKVFDEFAVVHYTSQASPSRQEFIESVEPRVHEIIAYYQEALNTINQKPIIHYRKFDSSNSSLKNIQDWVASLNLSPKSLILGIPNFANIRVDILPKILQFFNSFPTTLFPYECIVRSDAYYKSDNDEHFLLFDSSDIMSFPVLGNPLRHFFAISTHLFSQLNCNCSNSQSNSIEIDILLNIPKFSHIYTLPSVCVQIDLSCMDHTVDNLNSYLYGLTTDESVQISSSKFYKKILGAKLVNKHLMYPSTLKPVVSSLDSQSKFFAVIPFKNNLKLTLDCIKNFKSSINIDGGSLLAVATDNGSSPSKELDIIKQSSDYYFYDDSPYNYSRLNNVAVSNLRSQINLFNDYILLLNNDCILNESALFEMYKAISLSETIGAVGAKLYFPNGTIQHAGVGFDRAKKCYEPHKLYHIDAHQDSQNAVISSYSYFTDGCTAACLLLRARDFIKIKGFNESVVPCAHSDSYIYEGLSRLNKQILYLPFATGVHHEGLSKTFYYPDDLEANLAANLIHNNINSAIKSKQVLSVQ